MFVCVGGAALSWTGVQVVGAHVSQRAARRTLEIGPPPKAAVSGLGLPAARPVNLVRGTPLAVLSIPRLSLSAVVLHGSDTRTLGRGLGHIEHTARPGEAGNVGIAGHRDSFFRPLRHVRVGDEVLLDATFDRVRYRVTSLRVVSAEETSVLAPTTDSTLTLVTCYPFWLLGSAPDRFVVRATRVAGTNGSLPRTPAELVEPTETRLFDGNAQPTPPQPTPTGDLRPAGRGEPERARTHESDDAKVGNAIERFRQAYNATRPQEHEAPIGPLVFESCSLAITTGEAMATCPVATGSPDGGDARAWAFSLVSTNRDWVVKAVTRP